MPQIDAQIPDISVVIPAFRAAADIPGALASVFRQTFASYEVIVINDGSPDTAELVEALRPYQKRIRYIALDENCGAAVARNTGILAARGRYVAFLDADDRWFPDFLRRQMDHLHANPSCTVVYADAMISGQSALAGRRFMEGAPSDGDVTLLSLIEQRCNVILSTVVCQREALVAAGMFDPGLRRGQDFDLWLRMALRGAIIQYQRLVLAERRVRTGNLSGDAISELQRAIHVLQQCASQYALDASAHAAVRLRTMQLADRLEIEQGKQQIIEGRFEAARHHLAATRQRPLKLKLAMIALSVAPNLLRAIYVRRRAAGFSPALATSSR